MIKGGDGFPINFGETITGYSSSGAGGLNYSYSKSKYQRFFISYLGSGSKKTLNEQIKTTSYRESDSYFQEEQSDQIQRDTAHSINFGVRYLFSETNNIIINGGISYNTGYIPFSSNLSSFSNDLPINELERISTDASSRFSGNTRATYLKKINDGSTILKVSGNGSYSGNNSETEFSNQTKYFNPESSTFLSQFQDNTINSLNYGGALSLTQRLFESVYMDLSFSAANADENTSRKQGNLDINQGLIDTLSPEFSKDERSFKPALALRRNSEKSSLTIGLSYKTGMYSTSLWTDAANEKRYQYLQPRLNWEYRYKTGRRINWFACSMESERNHILVNVIN